MTYFKIIQNGEIVGAGCQFLKWYPRTRKMALCDLQDAQGAHDAVSERVYHADWLKNVPREAGITLQEADIALIDAVEYDEIIETLSGGETIPVPEPDPEPQPEPEPEPEPDPEERPMTVAEMREKIQEQAGQIEMLTECLMEMSELVYG